MGFKYYHLLSIDMWVLGDEKMFKKEPVNIKKPAIKRA